MKNLIILLFLLCFGGVWKAQTLSGEVFIHDNSMLYLNQVYVTNLNTDKTVLTNYQGEFSIDVKVGDKVRFTSIVTERRDITVTPELLTNKKNLIQLYIAYTEIQEVVIKKFKPTGNFRKDVLSLNNGKKKLALIEEIGLPEPKGNGRANSIPTAAFAGGGLTFGIQSIYDIISGDKKRKERLYAYEAMQNGVTQIHNFFGEEYFEKIKIPKSLINNFLEFVYTSDNISLYLAKGSYSEIQVSMEKYLPIYLKRLKNSNLQTIIEK